MDLGLDITSGMGLFKPSAEQAVQRGMEKATGNLPALWQGKPKQGSPNSIHPSASLRGVPAALIQGRCLCEGASCHAVYAEFTLI